MTRWRLWLDWQMENVALVWLGMIWALATLGVVIFAIEGLMGFGPAIHSLAFKRLALVVGGLGGLSLIIMMVRDAWSLRQRDKR